MELWRQLLSDEVGVASLAVIGVTTVIVCVILMVIYQRTRGGK
ncbi:MULTISPECIES: DUF3149 domain-containing protein [Crenobacter]|uniref:DUF3149 domain-containing protein n=2 Tax=Crenobacter TaxID=1654931 RepID=A0A4T0UT68_9NEIS|nr:MULTISPECIES: DUF3149 domain-containing protein [Crenobacter]NDV11730.1 DUF3149 domain-containing protein [Crenobacter caeni]TIC82122.1 DUF3149 domain-containing protein [Crenobacter intestini]